jgi:hypothetical protein
VSAHELVPPELVCSSVGGGEFGELLLLPRPQPRARLLEKIGASLTEESAHFGFGPTQSFSSTKTKVGRDLKIRPQEHVQLSTITAGANCRRLNVLDSRYKDLLHRHPPLLRYIRVSCQFRRFRPFRPSCTSLVFVSSALRRPSRASPPVASFSCARLLPHWCAAAAVGGRIVSRASSDAPPPRVRVCVRAHPFISSASSLFAARARAVTYSASAACGLYASAGSPSYLRSWCSSWPMGRVGRSFSPNKFRC